MSWPDYFPATCGVLYLGAAFAYAAHDKPGLSLAYAAYAVANIGLIWSAR